MPGAVIVETVGHNVNLIPVAFISGDVIQTFPSTNYDYTSPTSNQLSPSEQSQLFFTPQDVFLPDEDKPPPPTEAPPPLLPAPTETLTWEAAIRT